MSNTGSHIAIPGGIMNLAANRQSEELRQLAHKRELIQRQLNHSMPVFASERASWEPQRQQLQQALADVEAAIAVTTQLTGYALAERFAPEHVKVLAAQAGTGTAEPARFSHDAIEAHRFMERHRARRRLDAPERIVMAAGNGGPA